MVVAHFLLLIFVGICSKGPTNIISYPAWHMVHGPYSTVALASDTEQERHANSQRGIAVYATFGFLGFISLLGWWQQRNIDLTIAEIHKLPSQQRSQHQRTRPLHRTVSHMLLTYVANPVTMTMSHLYRKAYIIYYHASKLVRPRLRSGFRRLEWSCVSAPLSLASS